MNHLTDIRTVAVPVTDQDKALEFYVETLGFEKRMDVPLPQLGGRWITVAPAGATTSIALIPATEASPVGADTGIRLAAADAVAAHADLTERGVATDELLTWPGVPPMFTFRDQDNNKLFIGQE
jgi:catechol 2,3-dioxygenase-like lactoylglutathione lyase family enzyme